MKKYFFVYWEPVKQNIGYYFKKYHPPYHGHLTGATNYYFDEYLVTPINPHNLYNVYKKSIIVLAIFWGKAWENLQLWVQ